MSKDNYEKVINSYVGALKEGKIVGYKNVYIAVKDLLNAMTLQFELYKDDLIGGWDKQMKLVKLCINFCLPLVEKVLRLQNIENQLKMDFYDLYERCYILAGKRSFMHFLLAMEFRKRKKVWCYRIELFEPLIYYLNMMVFNKEIELIRISMPPGYGKSYLVTNWSAFLYGVNRDAGILRISSSDILVKQFGRDTANLLLSEEFCRIFPEYSKEVFVKKTEDEFQLTETSSNERNFLCKTRDGTIVGFRADVIIEDDLITGTQEAAKAEIHKSCINKHMVDWVSRGKDENVQVISIGTMFSPDDLLNYLHNEAVKNCNPIETRFKKYVEVFENVETGRKQVFITIPALDEDDRSTLERVFSTKSFLQKRDALLQDSTGMGQYLWQAVYMQDPVPPTGLDFNYTKLQTYDELPVNDVGKSLLSEYSTATIDPARAGKNYIAFPIFRQYDNKFYLVDAFFKKVPMTDAYDDIARKLKDDDVRKVWIETNTDTSLPQVIQDRLKILKHACQIETIYSTQKKAMKIKDMAGYIINDIVYPSQKYIKGKPMLKTFMEQMTSYSFDRDNVFDKHVVA